MFILVPMKSVPLFLLLFLSIHLSWITNAQDKYLYDVEQLSKKSEKEISSLLKKTTRKISSGKADVMDYYNNGLIKLLYLKDSSGGLIDFNKAIELDKSSLGPYIGRSRIREGRKDYKGALQDLNSALRIDSNNAVVYNNRGYLNQLQGNYEAAIVDYNKSIFFETRKTDEITTTYVNKAEALKLLYRMDEAEEVYNKIVKLFPENVKSYYERGDFYKERGNFDAALKDYDKAVEVSKNDPAMLIERAKFKDDFINDDKGAIEDCDAAIVKDPKNARFHYIRARPFYDMENFEEVVKSCGNALLYDSTLYDAYVLRANAYDFLGKSELAKKDYERAISIAPKNDRAYAEYITFYNKAKDYKNSIVVLKKFLESGIPIDQQNLKAYYVFLAELYFKIEDIPSGCEVCKKAEAMGSTEAEVLRVMNCQ